MNLPDTTVPPPMLISHEDGQKVIAALNDLICLMWPIDSRADNIYLHLHTEGIRVKVGRMLAEDFEEWHREDNMHDSILAALQSALIIYRQNVREAEGVQ